MEGLVNPQKIETHRGFSRNRDLTGKDGWFNRLTSKMMVCSGKMKGQVLGYNPRWAMGALVQPHVFHSFSIDWDIRIYRKVLMFARNRWNSMCDCNRLCCFGASFLQTASMHILMLLASNFFLRLPTEITFWTKYEPIWTLFLLSHKYEFPHWSIMSSFWGYCLNWLSWFRPCRVCSVHRKRLRSSRPRTGWAPILTETSGSRSWVSQGRPQVVAIFLTSSQDHPY